MKLLRLTSSFLFLLLLASTASAQTGQIVSYQLQIYNPGVNTVTGAPFITNNIPANLMVCNQPKPIIPPVVTNPQHISIDDPVNPGKSCIGDLSTFLLALPIPSPFGPYKATFTATNDFALTSNKSLESNPFFRANNPNTITGLSLF